MADKNNQRYFTLLTDKGKYKIAAAAANKGQVVFTSFAIGDGNGVETNPLPSDTGLMNEVWRGQLDSVVTDPKNPAAIIINAIIPHNVGGFWMREFGLFDFDGDMLAVVKPAPYYKATSAEGQLEDVYYEFQLVIGEQAQVVVLVDPSILWATREYVETRRIPAWQLMNTPWLPVKALDITTPPSSNNQGDTYVIPTGAKGDWKDKGGQIAEWTGQKWLFSNSRDGHGIGLPDGSIFIKIAGVYVPLTDLFDKRYSRLTTPPTDTYYVSPDGDDKNTGFSLKESFRTIDGAIKALIERYMTSKTINLIVAPGGTYDGFSVPPSFIGGWRISGNVNTPDQVIIDATKTSMRGANIATDGVILEGLTVRANFECIYYTGGNNLYIKDCHLLMAGVNSTALASYNGNIAVAGNCKITGTGLAALYARKGEIRLGVTELADIQTSRIEYNCSVSVANVYAAANGLVYIDPGRTMLEGTCNGRRFVANTNGVIMLNGQNANFIPGDIEGMTATGGVIS
ncbi:MULTISPECIES: phage tail protein [Bartonella]|uniref:phage tail-collar fiber domain-containing protein n=1 Tax=Bartonella TaxID=773 RepID=UPI0018DE2194|nr:MULTISPECIES: phage tail protein [Bartonella]MBI0169881.1 phage tail protein [Bartonella sp. W8167]MBI0176141.1 phage tail protein [Bartonella apis]